MARERDYGSPRSRDPPSQRAFVLLLRTIQPYRRNYDETFDACRE